jgi:hypothetical protein
MNLVSKDTAILITAYTGGNDPSHHNCGDYEAVQLKRLMTKTLVKHLKNSGYYVCVSAHSILDEETQNMCNAFIYDSNNCWQVDGVPTKPNYGVAEITAVQNGLNFLSGHGFKNVLKLCYDQHPNLDYSKLIQKFESIDKKLITLKDAYGVGTLCFFANIQFVKDTFSLNEIYRIDNLPVQAVERVWFDSIRDKGLMDKVYGYLTYDEMLELPPNSIHHFSSMDGNKLYDYNY